MAVDLAAHRLVNLYRSKESRPLEDFPVLDDIGNISHSRLTPLCTMSQAWSFVSGDLGVGIDVIGLAFHFVFVPVVLLGCIATNAMQREKKRRKSHVDILPLVEMPDTGKEAWIRHEQQKWFPKLRLMPQSITNDNYATVKEQFGFEPHPKEAPKFVIEKKFPSYTVNFAETCHVYLVYGDDPCRGAQEKDENTMDELTSSSLEALCSQSALAGAANSEVPTGSNDNVAIVAQTK
uniref:AGC-kinase C-terminal domain-containing protein n=1 Tax=Steinernema glaseri TaxID=37863 RepID=A0A1I7Z3H6_9BILA